MKMVLCPAGGAQLISTGTAVYRRYMGIQITDGGWLVVVGVAVGVGVGVGVGGVTVTRV